MSMAIYVVWTMDAHVNAMGAPFFVIYTHGGSVLAAMFENHVAPCSTPTGHVHAWNSVYHLPRGRC